MFTFYKYFILIVTQQANVRPNPKTKTQINMMNTGLNLSQIINKITAMTTFENVEVP